MESAPRQAIETYLSHLANERQLSALIFLYKEVLKVDLPYLSIPRPPGIKAGISKRVPPHILHHSFAVYLRWCGYSIEQIRKLMGHMSDKTTQYHYLRSIEPDIQGIKGPLD